VSLAVDKWLFNNVTVYTFTKGEVGNEVEVFETCSERDRFSREC
jgi:hypothetical protein